MIAALLLRFGIPRWIAIVALCVAAAGAALAYRAHLIHQGVSLEADRRDAIDAENDRRAHAELDQANARTAAAQAELAAALAHLDQLKSDLDHEQAASTALQSDLAAGRRRLSVLTRTRAPDSAGSTQGAAAAGVDSGGEPATATLDGRVASDLEWARSTRNEAIIALQGCAAAYDAVSVAADSK